MRGNRMRSPARCCRRRSPTTSRRSRYTLALAVFPCCQMSDVDPHAESSLRDDVRPRTACSPKAASELDPGFSPSRHASALRVGGCHAPCWPVAEHDHPAGLEMICARERMPSPVQSQRHNRDTTRSQAVRRYGLFANSDRSTGTAANTRTQ